jgi:ribosomal protein S12 methylthiotransferase accessory factor
VILQEGRLRLTRLMGLWSTLVDPKIGVVREISEVALDEDDPSFFHYFSRSCDTSRFVPYKNFSHNGGASTDRYVAMAKAVGEAVERYCSAIFDCDELLLSTYRQLGHKAVHPDLFTLYTPEQLAAEDFPWQAFTEDSPAHWTEGVSLVTGEAVLVPAASVFIPYYYQRDREQTAHVMQPISTGLACGASFTEAAVSGLCEVIERDAFTITWQARLSRPRIRPETLPPIGKDILRRYEEVGIQVQLMDITTDIGVPTILSIALSDAVTSPALALAAATDPSRERALVKTLEELAHTRKYAKQVMDYMPPIEVDIPGGHPQVKDQKEHLRFYCPQESKAFAEFAWASEETRDFADVADLSSPDPGEQMQRVVRRLSAAGLEAIVCDLTSPDIRELGLRVVRCVAPGAHPMQMGYRNRALGNRRLYEVPRKLGLRGLEPGEPDNPYPHPFP